MRVLKVLVACEESQEVCKAFRALGHEAYSCDIQTPSGGHPEWHILGDALTALRGGYVKTMDGIVHHVDKWDLLIAHPPCTYLSNAGARHLFPNKQLNVERYKEGLKAKEFFLQFLNADIPHICVENPVSSRIFEMPQYSQEFQPYWFGVPTSKKTRLWLKELPLLHPTNMVKPECGCHESGTWFMGGSRGNKERQKRRSKTFPEVAKAIAEQYSAYILNETNETNGAALSE